MFRWTMSLMGTLSLVTVATAQTENFGKPKEEVIIAAQAASAGNILASSDSGSVIVDLRTLRPSDEFNAFMERKKEQLNLSAEFKQALENTRTAWNRAKAAPNDRGAVDGYYNSAKATLDMYGNQLRNFIGDQKQGERLVREMKEQYDKAVSGASEQEQKFMREVDLKTEEKAQVTIFLDRITERINELKAKGEKISTEDARNIIKVVVAEKMLPIKVQLIAEKAANARLYKEQAVICSAWLERLDRTLTNQYAVANAQLSLIPDIAENHADRIQLEQLRRLSHDLQLACSKTSGAAFNPPAFFLEGTGSGELIGSGEYGDVLDDMLKSRHGG